MGQKNKFKVEDFLKDDQFINYALNISSGVHSKRENLLEKYSFLEDEAELAKDIITGKDILYEIPPTENELLKERIFKSLFPDSNQP